MHFENDGSLPSKVLLCAHGFISAHLLLCDLEMPIGLGMMLIYSLYNDCFLKELQI